ncbi:MAG TPA: DUF4762 family protein [Buttiauxella sp.]|jgi:hypothetical protein
MKKLNVSEAQVVIGGTCKTCTDSFEWVGDNVCNSVKTCTDKNGVVTKTYKTAPASSCKQPG